MNALVTGATGFIGANLTEYLLAAGHCVRVFVRSAARAAPLAARGADVIQGEITDAAALRSALSGCDTVFHLAGQLHRPGIPLADYEHVHMSGTLAVLAALASAPQSCRLVACSTTGVYGITGDHPADERAPYRPTNEYERTKLAAEQLIARTPNVPSVVIRPGLVYGPRDLHLLGLFRAIERGVFRPIGTRAVFFHPIYIDDLCEAFIRCARDDRAVGEVYNVAAEPATLRDIAAAIADALGVRFPRGSVPAKLAWSAALCGDALPTAWRIRAPMTRSRYVFLTGSRVYDVGKIRSQLEFSASTTLETGMAAAVSWYRGAGLIAAGRTL